MFSFDGEFYVMADELAELMREIRRRDTERWFKSMGRRALSTGAAFSHLGDTIGEVTRTMAALSRLFPMWHNENTEK